MTYLLDSNAVIALFKNHTAFVARIRRHRPEDVTISTVVAHELFYGAHKGRRTAETIARVEALRFEVLDFGKEDARKAGEIRAELASAGTPVGPYDVLIAGQAVARGMTLITSNTRELQRIPTLSIEDWQA